MSTANLTSHRQIDQLAAAIQSLSRLNQWTLAEQIPLQFDCYHPQGLSQHDDRFYVTTVDIEKSVGQMICFDRSGKLLDRIDLTQDECFHPGGFSVKDGMAVVPVAEYRPQSKTVMCQVDLENHSVQKLFEYGDHLGAAANFQNGDIIAMTWGAREIIQFDSAGVEQRRNVNPTHFIDFQDMQPVGSNGVICTGLIQATIDKHEVEIGGIALLDLETWKYTIEVPFFEYSPSGRVATCNPTWFKQTRSTLDMYAVPDDGRSDLLVWTTKLVTGR